MSEYTAEMAHAAAARGAAWMDRHCPNWANEIDIERLHLDDGSQCVLGQTAQCLVPAELDWRDWAAYSEVVDTFWPRGLHATATRLGFNVPIAERDNFSSTAYEMLTIAWKELIRQRLEVRA